MSERMPEEIHEEIDAAQQDFDMTDGIDDDHFDSDNPDDVSSDLIFDRLDDFQDWMKELDAADVYGENTDYVLASNLENVMDVLYLYFAGISGIEEFEMDLEEALSDIELELGRYDGMDEEVSETPDEIYTVKKGDTLSAIVLEHFPGTRGNKDLMWEYINALNSTRDGSYGMNPNEIEIGEDLNLTGAIKIVEGGAPDAVPRDGGDAVAEDEPEARAEPMPSAPEVQARPTVVEPVAQSAEISPEDQRTIAECRSQVTALGRKYGVNFVADIETADDARVITRMVDDVDHWMNKYKRKEADRGRSYEYEHDLFFKTDAVFFLTASGSPSASIDSRTNKVHFTLRVDSVNNFRGDAMKAAGESVCRIGCEARLEELESIIRAEGLPLPHDLTMISGLMFDYPSIIRHLGNLVDAFRVLKGSLTPDQVTRLGQVDVVIGYGGGVLGGGVFYKRGFHVLEGRESIIIDHTKSPQKIAKNIQEGLDEMPG